jgi:hypothetical protein
MMHLHLRRGCRHDQHWSIDDDGLSSVWEDQDAFDTTLTRIRRRREQEL